MWLDLAECGWDLAESGRDLAECGWDLAESGRDLAECGWDLAESGRDLAECGWDLAESGGDLAESGWVVRVSYSQYRSRNSRVGLGTEFRSEKIPRNRHGMVSVIPQKKALIPRHSEFHGRAYSEALNRTEQNWILRKKLVLRNSNKIT